MKILFVLPRYHTNQLPIVKALLERSHNVYIHVANHGRTEDHHLATPYRHKASFMSPLVARFFNQEPNNPEYIPVLHSYIYLLWKLAPDIVIAREHCIFWVILLIALKPVLGYELLLTKQFNPSLFSSSCTGRGTVDRRLRLKIRIWIFKLFNVKWTTPLRHSFFEIGYMPSQHFYLPFIAPNPSAINKPQEFRILSVGKYRPRKRHELIIKAVSEINQSRDIPILLTIIGECVSDAETSYFRYLQQLVSNYKQNPNINLLLNYVPSSMNDIYMKHSLLVHAAICEPASISVIEALAHGLPVICTDQCGTKCYVNPQESGIIIPAENINSLKQAIILFEARIHSDKLLPSKCIRSINSISSPLVFLKSLSTILEPEKAELL